MQNRQGFVWLSGVAEATFLLVVWLENHWDARRILSLLAGLLFLLLSIRQRRKAAADARP